MQVCLLRDGMADGFINGSGKFATFEMRRPNVPKGPHNCPSKCLNSVTMNYYHVWRLFMHMPPQSRDGITQDKIHRFTRDLIRVQVKISQVRLPDFLYRRPVLLEEMHSGHEYLKFKVGMPL
jgi:hypothetical protein